METNKLPSQTINPQNKAAIPKVRYIEYPRLVLLSNWLSRYLCVGIVILFCLIYARGLFRTHLLAGHEQPLTR